MKLWTAQMARYRLAEKRGIPHIDTTVKSGDVVFAPSWDIVMRHKGGTLTDQGYSDVYKEMMRRSYRDNTSRWMEVATMEEVCIMCYCPACTQDKHVFCHRYLLVTMFELNCNKHGIPFEYMGELVQDGVVMPRLYW